MQLAMIGPGRMGANIVRRLMRDGHACVVFDVNPKAAEALASEGAVTVKSLAELKERLHPPWAAWVMVPAGERSQKAPGSSTSRPPPAFAADEKLEDCTGHMEDSGEGRWTVFAALESAVPATVLTSALYERFRSRETESFADKIVSATRKGFGGHHEAKVD
jgi:6-phosphogluconate dehydrogenase (decarboxylating)